MDLLVIGIDGGDRRIIDAMDMPCLQGILDQLESADIKEDLWSRGWSEITTGMHGTITGAFYDKPALDGSTNFNQKYSVNDYLNVPGCKPLWQAIAERGKRVGFLNLPTSLPAPDVPGFFISGPGAGYSPASRIPLTACHPKDLYNKLIDWNPIWEQRFHVSGIQSIDYFIDRCCQAVQARSRLFADLSKTFKVDVGLIFHKEMVILANIFMYEIDLMVERGGTHVNPVQRRLAEFFRILDDSIQYLLNHLPSDSIMVVSDHSSRPYRYSLNLNTFLGDAEYLRHFRPATIRTKAKHLIQAAKTRTRESVRSLRLSRTSASLSPFGEGWRQEKPIDFERTRAFTSRYVPGIYINDTRFNGPVSTSEAERLIPSIIDTFNSSEAAGLHRMTASPYRFKYTNSYAQDLLPDIWVDLPDGIFPEAKGEFVQKNPYWTRFSDLTYVSKDIIGGMKGRDALCYAKKELIEAMDTSRNDLTIAYGLILSHLK